MDDDVFGQAAQLSYYFLLSIFPFLLFLTTLLGLLAQTGTEVYVNLVTYAAQVLPDSAFQLVFATLNQIQTGAGGGKLSFGILFTLWAASSGMLALMDGLNRASNAKETRPWWKARLVSIGLTVSLSGFVVTATTLVLYGERIVHWAAASLSGRTSLDLAMDVLEWPLVLIFLLIAFLLLYRYAPAEPRRPLRELMPGALVGMGLWLIVSLLFRLYLHFFNSYNATYGSLGAVIVLLLWSNLSGVAVLLGAEVNEAMRQ